MKVLRNTPLMERIGPWMSRRPSTLWSIEEAMTLQTISPPADEIDLMAAYYEAEISEARDYRRRDLQTLLNNWNGELDRATNFLNSQP